MTARERSLATTASETISLEARAASNANAAAARAASLAKPWPQAGRARRQPISTAGMNGASKPRPREPGEADEVARRALLERPQPPALALHVRLDPVGERVALARA